MGTNKREETPKKKSQTQMKKNKKIKCEEMRQPKQRDREYREE